MEKPRQLFMMGNKRSGTSLLVNLLNLHPKVFVTHESDIIWILYQACAGKLWYRCYPWDGPKGMRATLSACRQIFRKFLIRNPSREVLAEIFYRVEEHLMRHGSKVQLPCQKASLAWIGDKKPVQQSDPAIRPFLQMLFPEARYIHIVRHPQAVVASQLKAAKDWGVVPKYWKKRPHNILERWTIHEEWVLKAKSEETCPIHTLRFEDLCQAPEETMEKIFDFLGLDMPSDVAAQICAKVGSRPNQKYELFSLPDSPQAASVMELYDYQYH